MRISNSKFFVEDTLNGNQSIGITINQEANDDEIFALKSSDVAHGITSGQYAETCTYGTFRKQEATAGGLEVRGYKDADGANYSALVLQGILGETPNSTHTASGYGVVTMRASKVNSCGCGVMALGNCENVFNVDNHTNQLLIIDGSGDVFAKDSDLGGGLDDFCDPMLIRATELVRTQTTCYSGIIRSRHDDWTRDHYADLKAAGLYEAPPWEGGLLNISQWRRLANGAIWQLYTKAQDQAAEIRGLRNDMTAIQGGK